VVKCAAIIAAVLPNERLVRIAHAGINVGNHQPSAINSHCPNIVCVDMRQVGFDGIQAIIKNRSRSVGFVEDVGLTSLDTLDAVEFQNVIQNALRGAVDQDGVVDPVALIINLTT